MDNRSVVKLAPKNPERHAYWSIFSWVLILLISAGTLFLIMNYRGALRDQVTGELDRILLAISQSGGAKGLDELNVKLVAIKNAVSNLDIYFIGLFLAVAGIISISGFGLLHNIFCLSNIRLLKADYSQLSNRYEMLLGSKRIVDAELKSCRDEINRIEHRLSGAKQENFKPNSKPDQYK